MLDMIEVDEWSVVLIKVFSMYGGLELSRKNFFCYVSLLCVFLS